MQTEFSIYSWQQQQQQQQQKMMNISKNKTNQVTTIPSLTQQTDENREMELLQG